MPASCTIEAMLMYRWNDARVAITIVPLVSTPCMSFFAPARSSTGGGSFW